MSTALSGRGSFCSEPTHTLNGAVSERVRVRERERKGTGLVIRRGGEDCLC